jgi:hypothetical protein
MFTNTIEEDEQNYFSEVRNHITISIYRNICCLDKISSKINNCFYTVSECSHI